jgi:hypothetical protein
MFNENNNNNTGEYKLNGKHSRRLNFIFSFSTKKKPAEFKTLNGKSVNKVVTLREQVHVNYFKNYVK